MSEHSERDERRLRKALAMIGDEAGQGAAVPRRPVRRRWRPSGSLIAGAVLAAVVLALGGFALSQGNFVGGEPEPEEGGQGLSRAEGIACSQFIAEVEVVEVKGGEDEGRVVLVLEVLDPIEPADASGTVEFDVVDPAVADEKPEFEPGERLLIQVYDRGDEAPEVYRGNEIEAERGLLAGAMDEAEGMSCPEFWQEE